MSTNILFWNCQGIRPKRKELELYLKENVINVIALSEAFRLVVNKEYRNDDFNIITDSNRA